MATPFQTIAGYLRRAIPAGQPARAWLAALVLITASGADALELNRPGEHLLAVWAGYHDLIDRDPRAGIAGIEYRACCRWYSLRPALGTFVDTQGAWYAYGGFRSELASERRPFMFAVGTAIGYYRRGNGTPLGHRLEFRSGFEWYYLFENRSHLGIAFHHLSNASIGRRNPGTEILSLMLALPVGQETDSNPP